MGLEAMEVNDAEPGARRRVAKRLGFQTSSIAIKTLQLYHTALHPGKLRP